MSFPVSLLKEDELETLSRIRRGAKAVRPDHLETLRQFGLVTEGNTGIQLTKKGFYLSRIKRRAT